MLLVSGVVFLMHLGFYCWEVQVVSRKTTTLFFFQKLSLTLTGTLCFILVGSSFMNIQHKASWSFSHWLSWSYWGEGVILLMKNFSSNKNSNDFFSQYTTEYYFLFHVIVASTIISIFSSTIFQKTKMVNLIFFSVIYLSIIYPILASWKWSQGWIDKIGFHDFAGATLIHSFGGWIALAGILVFNPALTILNKKNQNNNKQLTCKNTTLTWLGCMILYLSIFGLIIGFCFITNNTTHLNQVIFNVILATIFSLLSSFFVSIFLLKKINILILSKSLLAGIISISSGVDTLSSPSALLVGMGAGILSTLTIIYMHKKPTLQDPLNIVATHLVGGVWGTLAVGLFSLRPEHTLMKQFIGISVYSSIPFLLTLIYFTIVKIIYLYLKFPIIQKIE